MDLNTSTATRTNVDILWAERQLSQEEPEGDVTVFQLFLTLTSCSLAEPGS